MSLTLEGTLSLYPTSSPTSAGPYPYFTTGASSSSRAVVFIGGLTNGMLSVGYVGALSEALREAGWRLARIIMHWSSAYLGYGTGSLDRDVREMSDLVGHLRGQGIKTIVLMGHSTGSQDVLHYLSHPSLSSAASSSLALSSPSPGSATASAAKPTAPRLHPVEGGILQAAVSDREASSSPSPPSPERQRHLDTLAWAEERVRQGQGHELIDREYAKKQGADWQPEFFTAQRFCDLYSTGGMDDYFSSDIPDESSASSSGPVFLHPLSTSFGALSAPALAIQSGADQFCAIKDLDAHLGRWKRAAKGKLEVAVVEGANHEVSGEREREVLCNEVVGWLRRMFP